MKPLACNMAPNALQVTRTARLITQLKNKRALRDLITNNQNRTVQSMANFSSLQTINNELYCFCFSEVARLDSSKFYVAVKQDDKLVTAFEMKKDSYLNFWVVCQPAPQWIIQEGATLAKIIEDQLVKSPA